MGGSMMGGLLKETVIGRYCKVRNAVIDKNVVIAAGTVLGYNRQEDEKRGLTTHDIKGTGDYIVVVPKDHSL